MRALMALLVCLPGLALAQTGGNPAATGGSPAASGGDAAPSRVIQGFKVALERAGKTEDGGTAVSVVLTYIGHDPVLVIHDQPQREGANIVLPTGEPVIGKQTGIPNCLYKTPLACSQFQKDEWITLTKGDEVAAAFTFPKSGKPGEQLSVNFRIFQAAKSAKGDTTFTVIPITLRGIQLP